MSLELVGDAGPSTELENAKTKRDITDPDEELKSPPCKRLKQSRLPFSLLVQQQEVSSNTLVSVKRKQTIRDDIKKFTFIDENEDDEVSSTQMETETTEIDVEIEKSDDVELEEMETDNANITQDINKSLTDGASDESICETKEDSIEVAVIDDTLTPNTKAKKRVILSKNERSLLKQKRAEESEKKRIEREEKLKEKEKLKEEARLKKEEKQKEILAKKQEMEKKKEERKLIMEERKKQKEEKQLEALAKKNEEKLALEGKKSVLEVEEQKREKAKASFASFFVKKDSNISTPRKDRDELSCLFRAFEVKENQRLAPTNRLKLEERQKLVKDLNECIRNQAETNLYLTELRCKKRIPCKTDRTWPLSDEADDELQVVDGEESCKKKNARAKLLKFHENVRPPYWGTWRKKSQIILSRNPFRKDIKYFDYEVDSDEEWEEEEPGESLSGTEDEMEKSDGEYDVDNEFVVPHGYLSDGEQDEEDTECLSIDGQKTKLRLQEKAFLAERKEKCLQIKPKLFGPIWCDDQTPGDEEILKLFKKFEMVLLCADLPIKINKICPAPSDVNKTEDQNTCKSTSRRLKYVPEEAMPHFIRLLHGNTHKRIFIVKEFSTFWDAHQEDFNKEDNDEIVPTTPVKKFWIPKVKLNKCLHQIASFEKSAEAGGKKMWVVKSEFLEKYSLTDLPLTNDWQYLTKIDKIDELLEVPEETPKTPTVLGALNLKECSAVDKSVKNIISTPKPKKLTLDTFFKRSTSPKPKENDDDDVMILEG
uniref:Chromatin assembly factor 1 subunit p150 C-terminal domain-containing protein n=1 Tax=Strigamia maritima TaxID=126957 RepID=T1JHB3_STRMM